MMWIARKEMRELLKQVEALHDQAARSGDEALMTGFQQCSNECFRTLLWAHMEVRQKLASLAGKLTAIATRPWI
jgi:hypothetical protein